MPDSTIQNDTEESDPLWVHGKSFFRNDLRSARDCGHYAKTGSSIADVTFYESDICRAHATVELAIVA